MKDKSIWKISIDFAMTVLVLCQMAYLLIGETEHEWMGTFLFSLFGLHHLLNVRWYGNLFRGRYTVYRAMQSVLNMLLFVSMGGCMISGMIISKEVFAFLPINGGRGLARKVHMLSSYWGFFLMSLHLGFHWSMGIGMLHKVIGQRKNLKTLLWILRGMAMLLCGFGAYAFVKYDLLSYMFLKNQFVFFDVEQPLLLFLGEYIAIMGLWACISYYIANLTRKFFGKKSSQTHKK